MNILILSYRPNIGNLIASQFQQGVSRIYVAPSLAKSRSILKKTKIDCIVVIDSVSDVMIEDVRRILIGMIDCRPMLVHVRSSFGDAPCYCGFENCIPFSMKLLPGNIFRKKLNQVNERENITIHADWRASRSPLEVNGYRFTPACNNVSYGNESIRLRQKEFDLAYLIFNYYREVVAHAEIMRILWPGDNTKTLRNIVPHMSTIRRKLNLTPEGGLVIKSIYGEGYRLEECDPFHHG